MNQVKELVNIKNIVNVKMIPKLFRPCAQFNFFLGGPNFQSL